MSTYNTYVGDGIQQVFAISFPYSDRSHAKVYVTGIDTPFTWLDAGTIQLNTIPLVNSSIVIRRETPHEQPAVDFNDGNARTGEDLDIAFRQSLYVAQEAFDQASLSPLINENAYTITVEAAAHATAAAASEAGVAASAASAISSATSANTSMLSAIANASAAAASAALAYAYGLITTVTGSIKVPASTTANRDVGATAGFFRFNTDVSKFEGHNGSAWGSVGGGATGGGTDAVFYLNGQTITSNYTIPVGQNAGSFGPITISDGISVEIPTGSTWSIT